jgi:hypothetical protein
LFKNDLALIVTQYAGYKVDILLQRALDLNKLGLSSESKRAFDRAFDLLIMMDALTSTIPDQRLERMIENARKYGYDKSESDYYEADAKRQLTQWGDNSTPVLHEYASKVWSGLIRSYYLGRWSAYARSLQNNETLDLNEWELNWIKTPGLLTKATTTGDVIKYASSLYKAANDYIVENMPLVRISMVYAGNNKALISLHPLANDLTLNYTTNGSTPSSTTTLYDKPFEVELPATIKAIASRGKVTTGDISTVNIPVSFGKPVTISPDPDNNYKARMGATLTDAVYGSLNQKDGNWLGYEGNNVSVVIALEGKHKVSKVNLSYLLKSNAWIFSPSSAIVETSNDGITYKSAGAYDFDISNWDIPANKDTSVLSFPETEASYIRLLIFNRGICPANHPGAGKKAWLFIDEITAE